MIRFLDLRDFLNSVTCKAPTDLHNVISCMATSWITLRAGYNDHGVKDSQGMPSSGKGLVSRLRLVCYYSWIPRTCLASEILWQSTRFIVLALQQQLQVNLRIEYRVAVYP